MTRSSLAEQWTQDLAMWAMPREVTERSNGSHFALSPSQFALTRAYEGDIRVELIKDYCSSHSGEPLHLIDIGSAAGSSIGALLDEFAVITCVESNSEMIESLQEQLTKGHHRSEINIVEGSFPQCLPRIAPGNVVNASNVLYNVADIEAMLDGLAQLATGLITIEATTRHPLSQTNEAFTHFYGVQRPTRPTVFDAYEIIADYFPSAQLRRYPARYRRTTMDADALRIRLGLDESRLGEVAEFLKDNPPKQNPSVLIYVEISS